MDSAKSQLAEDMESFSDIKSLKQWLNTLKKSHIPKKEQDMMDEYIADIFDF